MRATAPAVFSTSPQTSPTALTALAASTARKMNWTSAPGLIDPERTNCAPIQSTATMLPNTNSMTATVSRPRALSRSLEAVKAVSTAWSNRPVAARSRPKAWTVSSWSSVSPA